MSSHASPTPPALDVSSPESRKRLRQVLGQFATGVTVVTTVDDQQRDVGLTVNSYTSVSLQPPLVLWCLGRKSTLLDTFSTAPRFAINVLSAAQADLALRFAGAAADKFAGIALQRGIGEVALLPGSVATLQCVRRDVLDGGDHVILLGEVVQMQQSAGDALLFHRGEFASTAAPGAAAGGPA
jgi:flavin reductase (DIM6/NTAB) family NADH-FMN oxidoreductase RutF